MAYPKTYWRKSCNLMQPNKNNVPLCSIIIPTFNREHVIRETISSALAQTVQDIEIVVQDNASTDDTWRVVCEMALSDGRVKPEKNIANIGPVRNWVTAVRRARGEFGMLLWSDDLLAPEFLEKTVPILADPSIGFVYTGVRIFSAGKFRDRYRRVATGAIDSRRFIEDLILWAEVPVSPGCALFRLRDLKHFLTPEIRTPTASDFAGHGIGPDALLLLKVASIYPRVAHVSEILAFFRDHPGSITASSTRGRVVLHYDLVFANFLETTNANTMLLRRFLSILRIHLLRYDGRPWGLSREEAFFFRHRALPTSFRFLLQKSLELAKRAFVHALRKDGKRSANRFDSSSTLKNSKV